MMFKLLTTALTIVTILGLSACATTATETPSEAKAVEAQAVDETVKAVADSETTVTKAVDTEAANTKTASVEDDLICKREAIIGSKFKRKVCGTAAQWEASAEASRRKTGDVQRRGRALGGSN